MRRKVPLVTGEVYHIFNRGVNKGEIFFSEWDYRRFYSAALHYKNKSTKFSYEKPFDDSNDPGSLEQDHWDNPKVEILAYCLMPNHFHFLLKQLVDKGATSFLQKLCNSYSHYVNLKHNRVGPLFQGPFKNVLVKSQEQLIHVSRYIHLNPLISGLVSDLEGYERSSYLAYIGKINDKLAERTDVMSDFKTQTDYKRFVLDHADYAKTLESIKHLVLDSDS